MAQLRRVMPSRQLLTALLCAAVSLCPSLDQVPTGPCTTPRLGEAEGPVCDSPMGRGSDEGGDLMRWGARPFCPPPRLGAGPWKGRCRWLTSWVPGLGPLGVVGGGTPSPSPACILAHFSLSQKLLTHQAVAAMCSQALRGQWGHTGPWPSSPKP